MLVAQSVELLTLNQKVSGSIHDRHTDKMENIKHIKNIARAFKKENRIVVYLISRTSPSMYDWQHRLRVRSILFGHSFTTYHPEMDFTLALESGWNEQPVNK